MFAVIRTGGKQYTVEPGTILEIERIAGVAGEQISISDVLLIADGNDTKIGTPLLNGATVTLKIIEQKRGPKVKIFKKIRRHGKQLSKGHRQELSRVQVSDISVQ